MLSSTDRPRIKVGDEVPLAVAGLNQAEYGTVIRSFHILLKTKIIYFAA